MTRGTIEGLAGDLVGLAALDSDGLKERWHELYGSAPPAHASRSYLIRALAYRLQETALGGLKPQTRRLLAKLGEDATNSRGIVLPRPTTLTPGTRLVREWQGTTHQVLVLEDGVLFRGQRYRSLSAVARLITGSRWSGPLFFGLKPSRTAQP